MRGALQLSFEVQRHCLGQGAAHALLVLELSNGSDPCGQGGPRRPVLHRTQHVHILFLASFPVLTLLALVALPMPASASSAESGIRGGTGWGISRGISGPHNSAVCWEDFASPER